MADLPVGHNLQDHIYPGGIHFTIDQPVSLSQKRIFTIDNLIKYFTKGTGKLRSSTRCIETGPPRARPLTAPLRPQNTKSLTAGPLASTGVDGLAFVSTKLAFERHPQLDWPDIEMHMIPADVVADGGRYLKHLAGLRDEIWHGYYKHYLHSPSFSIDPVLLRPRSRGRLWLRSRDPHEQPMIDPNYLSHPDDIATIVDGMKLAIEIGLSQAFRHHFNARLFELPVPGCGQHPFLSDRYLECVARTLTWTIYHPVGTCKMVADHRDPSGVVDAQLRVLGGITGLRVVDASIMPNIVSGECRSGAASIKEAGAPTRLVC